MQKARPLENLDGVGVPASIVDCARSRCTAVRHKRRLYMFGGCGVPDRFSGTRMRGDVCCVDVETSLWYRVLCCGAAFPPPRAHHATCIWDHHLVIHAGVGADGAYLNDMWALSLEVQPHEWTKVAMTMKSHKMPAPAPPIAHHASKVYKQALWIHGGLNPVPSPQLYRFNFSMQDLEVVEAANSGPILYNHKIDVVDGVLYAFGGLTYSQGQYDAQNNQLFCFDLATRVWRAVSFRLKGVEGDVNDFARPPLMVHIVRQTRQMWCVGRGGKVYIAALPSADTVGGGRADALVFFLHCSPGKYPEYRVNAVTAAVGRTLWLMFGEEECAAHPGGLTDPMGVSGLLSEDYLSARRSYTDLHIFAIDTSSFTSSVTGLLAASRGRPLGAGAPPTSSTTPARSAPQPLQQPQPAPAPPQASEVATSPVRYRELREGGKVAALTRLLKEKHDFDKVKDILIRQDIMAHNEINEYGELLGATVEKYLSGCEAPKKHVGRKRRELQQAKLQSQSLKRRHDAGDPTVTPTTTHRELRRHRRRHQQHTDNSRAWAERKKEAATCIQSWVRRVWIRRAAVTDAELRRAQRETHALAVEEEAMELETRYAAEKLQRALRCVSARSQRRARAAAQARRICEQEALIDQQISELKSQAAVRIQCVQRGRSARVTEADTARKARTTRGNAWARAACDQEFYFASRMIQCFVRRRRAMRTVEGRRMARRNAAATRIQSLQRGRVARRRAEERRREVAARHAAATKIQTAQRGRAARAEAERRRAAKKAEEERAAATRIQALQRGRVGRKEAAGRRERAEEHSAAATRIQAAQRGRAARAHTATLRDQRAKEEMQRREVAATGIQAQYRGHVARKDVARRRASLQRAEDDRQAAATRIQAVQRGRTARREVGGMRAAHKRPRPSTALELLASQDPPRLVCLDLLSRLAGDKDGSGGRVAPPPPARSGGRRCSLQVLHESADDAVGLAKLLQAADEGGDAAVADGDAAPPQSGTRRRSLQLLQAATDEADTEGLVLLNGGTHEEGGAGGVGEMSPAAHRAAVRIQCQLRRHRARRAAAAKRAAHDTAVAREVAEEENRCRQAAAATIQRQMLQRFGSRREARTAAAAAAQPRRKSLQLLKASIEEAQGLGLLDTSPAVSHVAAPNDTGDPSAAPQPSQRRKSIQLLRAATDDDGAGLALLDGQQEKNTDESGANPAATDRTDDGDRTAGDARNVAEVQEQPPRRKSLQLLQESTGDGAGLALLDVEHGTAGEGAEATAPGGETLTEAPPPQPRRKSLQLLQAAAEETEGLAMLDGGAADADVAEENPMSPAAHRAAVRIQCQLRRHRARQAAERRRAEQERRLDNEIAGEEQRMLDNAALAIQCFYLRRKAAAAATPAPADGGGLDGISQEQGARAVLVRRERADRITLGLCAAEGLREAMALTLCRMAKHGGVAETTTPEQHAAARRIQSLHRGNRGRRVAAKREAARAAARERELVDEDERCRDAAALQIQSLLAVRLKRIAREVRENNSDNSLLSSFSEGVEGDDDRDNDRDNDNDAEPVATN